MLIRHSSLLSASIYLFTLFLSSNTLDDKESIVSTLGSDHIPEI